MQQMDQAQKVYIPGELTREYRRATSSLKKIPRTPIENIPTIEMPVLSPYMCSTDTMIAQILTPHKQNVDRLYVDVVDSSGHTIDLIHQGVKKLFDHFDRAPRLIRLSRLRYMALGDLSLQLKYYYHGVYVPFLAADEQCHFDVRVYGQLIAEDNL